MLKCVDAEPVEVGDFNPVFEDIDQGCTNLRFVVLRSFRPPEKVAEHFLFTELLETAKRTTVLIGVVQSVTALVTSLKALAFILPDRDASFAIKPIRIVKFSRGRRQTMITRLIHPAKWG